MDPARLLDGLDAGQRAAVTETTHPLAILAGAGSGKTRVLTRRIAFRCLSGDADPRRVLAVTFTRKAAAELDDRLRALGLRDLPAAGTFHALAYAQLRERWAEKRTAPAILDRKARFLARILGSGRRMTPAELASEIEWAKARLIAPERYALEASRADRRTAIPHDDVAALYRRYEQDKRKRGVVDFDDLLMLAIAEMESDPSFAAALRWRHRHLFVDEYQDVNPLQERLLRTWLGDRTDLCVVGDPNQAIYGWNGADPGHLARFADHHPGARVIELTDSYRSSPQILRVAGSVLAIGGVRRGAMRPHRPDGTLPAVVGYPTALDEANGIARALRDEHRPGRSWSKQAVLVRTNAQTAIIETALRRAAIPHRVRGGRRFLEDQEVRDLLDRLDRLREPLSTTLEDLAESVALQRADVLATHHGTAATATDAPLELPDTAVGRRIGHFEQVIRLGHEMLAMDPTAVTSAFPGWLRTFLRDEDPDRGDAVTISTFHAAKGLEWDAVHIAGVEDGFVPISHARTPESRAEEIRLLYVAVTRAAEVLRCTWAASRDFGERTVERRPSPYLEAIRSTIEGLRRDEVPVEAPTEGLESSRSALHSSEPVEDLEQLRRGVDSALRSWRAQVARAAAVRPTVVLGERTLRRIATDLPRTQRDLERIETLGPVLRARHGEALLAVVAERLDRDVDGDHPTGAAGTPRRSTPRAPHRGMIAGTDEPTGSSGRE